MHFVCRIKKPRQSQSYSGSQVGRQNPASNLNLIYGSITGRLSSHSHFQKTYSSTKSQPGPNRFKIQKGKLVGPAFKSPLARRSSHSQYRGSSIKADSTGRDWKMSARSLSTNNRQRLAIFCPAQYRHNNFFKPHEFNQPLENLVLATEREGWKCQKDYEKLVRSRKDIDRFVAKHPSTKVFSFDQVLNDNLSPVRGSKPRRRRARSRLSSVHSNTSNTERRVDYLGRSFFKDSLIKEKLLATLGRAYSATPAQ